MSRISCALCVALSASCVVGSPPGFSDGDRWQVPLVAPLEHDVLLLPVKINDTGPYLFAVDPDSNVSSIDNVLSTELQLMTRQHRDELSENDKRIPVYKSEVKTIAVGNLTVRNREVNVHKFGSFWVGGRRVRGLLGRDVIADSLVFAADRDAGIAYIGTQGNLPPPTGAAAVKFRPYFRRNIATVMVAGNKASMHIDLGGPVSQAWAKKLNSWQLPAVGKRRRMTDEYGTVWETSQGATASSIELAGHSQSNIVLVPFADGRVEEEELDGTIGQDVLSHYNVTANWHEKTIWLQPRNPDLLATADARIKRWGSVFEGCKQPACVSVEVIGGQQPTPPPTAPQEPVAAAPSTAPSTAPGATVSEVQLHVAREASVLDLDYEVLIEALDQNGKSLGLPRILVALPKGAATIVEPRFDPTYAAAKSFAVVDLSPFRRECEKRDSVTSCVWRLRM